MADDEGRAPLVEDVAMEVEVRRPVVAANYTAMRRRTASRNLTHFQVWRPNCTRWKAELYAGDLAGGEGK